MKERKCLLTKYTILILALVIYIILEKKRLRALIYSNEKNHLLYLFSTQWLYRKINGDKVFACLEDNGYKKIAIYGKNHSCECLCSELESMGINVACIISDNVKGRYGNIPIVKKNNMPKDVDAIIITNLGNAESIKNKLKDRYAGTMLVLEDIVKWG